MKVSHKRVPSGCENSSLLQNTQRLAVPKKITVQPSTTKRQPLPQNQLYSILEQTNILHLYQAFLSFHIEVENLLKSGTIQQAKQCCFQLRQMILNESQNSYQKYSEQSIYCESQGEKIKELLQEIYMLRKKVAGLDESLNGDSISSLDECIIEDSQQTSSKKIQTISKEKNHTGKNPSQDYECIYLETINNYLELKTITFQLVTLSSKIIQIHMPDESVLLWERIKQSYQIDVNYLGRLHHPEVAADSLDRMVGLVFLLRCFVDKLEYQFVMKKQNSQ